MWAALARERHLREHADTTSTIALPSPTTPPPKPQILASTAEAREKQVSSSLMRADTRRAFIGHCLESALKLELPDYAESPARTNAFRMALRNAIADLGGITEYKLYSYDDALRVGGKLKKGVVAYAKRELEKNAQGGQVYAELLDERHRHLLKDVASVIDRFAIRAFVDFRTELRAPTSPTK